MKEILLTGGLVTQVDDEDYEYLNQFKWRINRGSNGVPYAIKCGSPRYENPVLMHRFILGCPNGIAVDHRDMNTLNNTRINIRIADYTQNNANRIKQKNNTSGFRGVCWERNRARWRAKIAFHRKRIHLGYFKCKEDAIKAYRLAAIKIFGEYYRE